MKTNNKEKSVISTLFTEKELAELFTLLNYKQQ